MTNTAAFSAVDIHSIFGSQAIIPDYFASSGVSTDTRTMNPGNIFIALRGERFDAHENIAEAIIKGASCVVFEDRWLAQWNKTIGLEFPKFSRIVVHDSLIALGKLATYHRQRYEIPVIAVAGANGKTTTKDIIAHIFSSQMLTLKTEANYNNRVGVPLTLLQLSKFHRAAVVEIGTNEPGEIEILSDIVHPTHGIITNIGEEHLEKLIDLDGVEREETSLFRYCQKHNAVALVNNDDERLRPYSSQLSRSFSYGMDSASELRASMTFTEALEPVLHLHHHHSQAEVTLSIVGFAAGLNAVAAAAVACAAGIELSSVAQALSTYTSGESHGYARMVVQWVGELCILNDCYNANPSSMRMALKTLESYPCTGRRLALLGDMRELGEATARAHEEILRVALESAHTVIIVGQAMTTAAKTLKNTSRLVSCDSKSAAAAWIADFMKRDDVLLVKASRGIGLETVIEALKN